MALRGRGHYEKFKLFCFVLWLQYKETLELDMTFNDLCHWNCFHFQNVESLYVVKGHIQSWSLKSKSSASIYVYLELGYVK